jgi:hypothetical protein
MEEPKDQKTRWAWSIPTKVVRIMVHAEADVRRIDREHRERYMDNLINAHLERKIQARND